MNYAAQIIEALAVLAILIFGITHAGVRRK